MTECFKDLIVDLSMVNSTEDYKNLLSREWEYGGNVELTCISRLFSNYLLGEHYGNSTNTVDYGSESIVYHLLFSGNYNTKHFDLILKTNII